jgi:ADP-ribose pyrophosphatase
MSSPTSSSGSSEGKKSPPDSSGVSASASAPQRWLRGESRLLQRTRILDLNAVEFHHPGRQVRRDFVVVDTTDWVNVLALTGDDRLVLVNQYRYGIDDFSWEIPGGVIERGEDPVAAGVRELLEETGYSGRDARLLASVHPNPAFLSNRCHLVLVEDCRPSGQIAWDADEELEVAAVPVAEVYQRARAGGITHSLVLNALFFFEPFWRQRTARRGSAAE